MLNPLDHPVIFSRPLRMVGPTWWLPHVPFAKLLVDLARPNLLVELGTHTGSSYSGFCQAVMELGLRTHCYAVDTWEGDPHEGFYGDEIFEEWSAFHDTHFGGFSSLIRATFDAGALLFADASIELLHIDGYHTYEAVRHDFETWLPKVSPRGVVVLHDISVRKADFGVWKYWSELRQQYPTFEFTHGQGLGVVFTGSEHPGEAGQLLSMKSAEASSLQAFFHSYGSTLAKLVEVDGDVRAARREKDQAVQAVQALRAQVAERQQAVQALRAQVAEKQQALRAEVAERQALRAERQQAVQSLGAQLAEIRGSPAWRLAVVLRRLGLVLVPPGSVRIRMLHSLIVPLREIGMRRRLNKDLALVRSSGLFEDAWYLANNPDVAHAKIDPLLHYVLHGGFEGRDPNPNFRSGWYLDTYADVAASGRNPLLHFLEGGRDEGRAPRP